MAITMYDAEDPAGITGNPQAVAGYVLGGDYPTLVAKFPNAHHLSIATHPGAAADCIDVENGDATPEQALVWVQWRLSQGAYRPCVYASIANFMPQVIEALAHVPRADYRLWVAHWTPQNPPTAIPNGYDAVQWRSTPEFDQSLCRDDFFTTGPAKPAPKPTPPKLPVLTAALAGGLEAVDLDLTGILRLKGKPLTQQAFDQCQLAANRFRAIPGIK